MRRLLAALVSPRVHVTHVVWRFRSHLVASRPALRLAAALYLTVVVGALLWVGSWRALVFGWFVPLFPLYEMSKTLRLCVEHDWPASGEQPLTHGSSWVVPPDSDRTAFRHLLAWTGWAAAMTGHAACRFLVLVGDTPCHDYHHDHPQSYDWPNELTARQRNLELRRTLGLAEPSEVWGLCNAIGRHSGGSPPPHALTVVPETETGRGRKPRHSPPRARKDVPPGVLPPCPIPKPNEIEMNEILLRAVTASGLCTLPAPTKLVNSRTSLRACRWVSTRPSGRSAGTACSTS